MRPTRRYLPVSSFGGEGWGEEVVRSFLFCLWRAGSVGRPPLPVRLLQRRRGERRHGVTKRQARRLPYFAGRGAEPRLSARDHGAARQQRQVLQGRVVLHDRVLAHGGPGADEAALADGDAPDLQLAVLDGVAQQVRVGVDAGVLADGEQVVDGERIAGQMHVGADLRPHQPEIDVQQRRAGQVADGDGGFDGRRKPPAEVERAPQRIGARAVTANHDPLHRDRDHQHQRIQHDEAGEGAKDGFEEVVLLLDQHGVGEIGRQPLQGEEAQDEEQADQLRRPAEEMPPEGHLLPGGRASPRALTRRRGLGSRGRSPSRLGLRKRAASFSTVGCWYTSSMESCRSAGLCLSSETMRAASSEWPPRSRKKSSRTDTGVGANSFSHTATICFSRPVRGGTRSCRPSAARVRGAGRLLRSTLPLASVGNCGECFQQCRNHVGRQVRAQRGADGVLVERCRPAAAQGRRRVAGPLAHPRAAPPPPPGRRDTPTAPTQSPPAQPGSRESSPGVSMRPRNSSLLPSGVQRARSPVR